MLLSTENLISLTLEEFPKFKETERFKISGQDYLPGFFHSFSMYVVELIRDNINNGEIQKIFDFINKIVESSDQNVQKIGIEHILGNLMAFDEGIDVCNKYLNKTGKGFVSVMTDPDKLTYYNVVRKLLNRFPEFKETEHFKYNDDLELPYTVFFGFSNYVNEQLSKNSTPYEDQSIRRAFDLFNEMLESKDEQLKCLAVVEVIETLVQEKQGKKACMDLLREEGQKQLQEVLRYTGIKD